MALRKQGAISYTDTKKIILLTIQECLYSDPSLINSPDENAAQATH